LSTDPHEADGVEGAFVVFVASSPSGLTNPDEPDGVAAKPRCSSIWHIETSGASFAALRPAPATPSLKSTLFGTRSVGPAAGKYSHQNFVEALSHGS
ncbi:MAG TPA: hypothetical protein PLY87_21075, partial [Planctomycetaceae bacterium]|nr:hypothetical protein [Planctomycetaceae bacterium]